MPQFDAPDIRRGLLPSANVFNAMKNEVEAASRVEGHGVHQMPHGTQFLPPDIVEIWMIIGGQGSGSGANASNNNRYTWQQGVEVADEDTPGNERIIVDPSGLYGDEELNPAIEVTGLTDVPSGAIVRGYLSSTKNAWYFVYGGATGNGSGSGNGNLITITCGDGSTHTVLISGSSITEVT